MRATTVIALALLLSAPAYGGDEPPKPPAAPPAAPAPAPVAKPAPPPTPEQAADAVLAAVKAKDDADLKALAAKDDPDPWLVADELIRRGEHDAAEAFSAAAPRVDTEKLPAYIALRRGKLDVTDRRAQVAAANLALSARKPEAALAALNTTDVPPTEDVVGVRLLFGRGSALAALARWKAASVALMAAAEGAERLGWLRRASDAYDEAGRSAFQSSAFAFALSAAERRRSVCEKRGDRVGAAKSLRNMGMAHDRLGDYSRAISTYERLLAEADALGDARVVALALNEIGVLRGETGDASGSLMANERCLIAYEALGDKRGSARMLNNIGVNQRDLGMHATAILTLERSLAAFEALKEPVGAALAVRNIGIVHSLRGEFSQALKMYDRALSMQRASGDKSGAIATESSLGSLHRRLGNHSMAITALEQALAGFEELGSRGAAAGTLASLGGLYSNTGDSAKALSLCERALEIQEAMGLRSGAADTLNQIGLIQIDLGNPTKALATLERAMELYKSMGNRLGVAYALGNTGVAYESIGDPTRALSTYERALAANEELGDRDGVAFSLDNIASACCKLHDWRGALDAARRGAALVPLIATHLGDEQSATTREQHGRLFVSGALAAAELHNLGDVAYFLEAGRAGSLLEALHGRESLQSWGVPPALLLAEAQASAGEAYAANAYRRALSGGDLVATRSRRRELDAAQDAVQIAVERIQREAKAAANITHFQTDDLDMIRQRVAPGDAIILFGLFGNGAIALIVTSKGVTVASLPLKKDIDAACEGLLEAIDERTGPDAVRKAADALRDLVVKPLVLAPETRRLLISPDGALSYVPFALLVPDREVGYVPSGTAYGLLLEDGKARGEGVLALGDPNYQTTVGERAADIYQRGGVGQLARLPATADEARSIGAPVLLDKDATEQGLREAIAKRPRWRAVHLACHGIIDTDRPGLSSLALTPSGEDDGFLTVLEVFRSRVSADLVVLSACETAKGKVVKGEGIMGLTRAFMFAGAPRVICSLWKVDDEATKALMVKFYELWNPKDGKPGLPTAEALKQAQEFVKAQEKWKHPYYWAAWVLWGLPD